MSVIAQKLLNKRFVVHYSAAIRAFGSSVPVFEMPLHSYIVLPQSVVSSPRYCSSGILLDVTVPGRMPYTLLISMTGHLLWSPGLPGIACVIFSPAQVL